jgi:hypothetical protein
MTLVVGGCWPAAGDGRRRGSEGRGRGWRWAVDAGRQQGLVAIFRKLEGVFAKWQKQMGVGGAPVAWDAGGAENGRRAADFNNSGLQL